ncbi:MAG: NUDIX domain-containing protein [Clostridiaceae bacterium]|nr:NUDIX domain-containing protein [Clostridiaceae bacterium]
MNNIRVGCSVLIQHNNKLLLGIRDKEPNKGKVITPGGGIELFENMEDTVKREVMEETGLNISNIQQLKTYQIINQPDEHRIIIYWSAKYESNSIHSATDLKNARFYSKEEIKQLDDAGKLSEITKQVLFDNNWL